MLDNAGSIIVLLFSGVGAFQVSFLYFTYINLSSLSPLPWRYSFPNNIPQRWEVGFYPHFPYYNHYAKLPVSLKIVSLGYTNLKFKNLWLLFPIISAQLLLPQLITLTTQTSIHWPLIFSSLSSLDSMTTFQIFFCQHFQFLCLAIFLYSRYRSTLSFNSR